MTTFVASNIRRGGLFRLINATGFFYACVLIYSVTPVWSVNAPTASLVLDNGSVTPFFSLPQINIEKMSVTREKRPNTNNSSVPTTLAHETSNLPPVIQYITEYRTVYDVPATPIRVCLSKKFYKDNKRRPADIAEAEKCIGASAQVVGIKFNQYNSLPTPLLVLDKPWKSDTGIRYDWLQILREGAV